MMHFKLFLPLFLVVLATTSCEKSETIVEDDGLQFCTKRWLAWNLSSSGNTQCNHIDQPAKYDAGSILFEREFKGMATVSHISPGQFLPLDAYWMEYETAAGNFECSFDIELIEATPGARFELSLEPLKDSIVNGFIGVWESPFHIALIKSEAGFRLLSEDHKGQEIVLEQNLPDFITARLGMRKQPMENGPMLVFYAELWDKSGKNLTSKEYSRPWTGEDLYTPMFRLSQDEAYWEKDCSYIQLKVTDFKYKGDGNIQSDDFSCNSLR